MKSKNIILGLLFLSLFLMTLNFASAATLRTPAGSSIIGGATVALNTTVTIAEAGLANFSCSYYAKSSLTANSTWSLLAVSGNNTAGQGTDNSTNITFNSRILEDANNYILNSTCVNNSEFFASVTNTGITVDNHIPAAPSLSPATNTQVKAAETATFTGTVIGANTTSCTYTIYRGDSSSDGTSGSATHTGNTCTFTKAFTTTQDNGDWSWRITASDETNSSISGTNIYSFSMVGANGGLPGTDGTLNINDGDIITQNSKKGIGVIVLVILLIGTIVWFKNN